MSVTISQNPNEASAMKSKSFSNTRKTLRTSSLNLNPNFVRLIFRPVMVMLRFLLIRLQLVQNSDQNCRKVLMMMTSMTMEPSNISRTKNLTKMWKKKKILEISNVQKLSKQL
uniref:Uncharacterized protein n=1 Tax=Cacopsylla melanoneura TaxID=428564 RepID=A0A8D9FKE1_9HEMI